MWPDNQILNLFGIEVICDETTASRKHKLVAARRITILVKIKRRASRLIRETDDAVPRIGIDPIARSNRSSGTALHSSLC